MSGISILYLLVMVISVVMLVFRIVPVIDWESGFRFEKRHPIITRAFAGLIFISAALGYWDVNELVQWTLFIFGVMGIIFIRDKDKRMKMDEDNL